ncbi:receptor-like serine/threonine kinase, partial [Trifolium medium]|nr:receptor-like serine/threonine kinase [Trifolium medium]
MDPLPSVSRVFSLVIQEEKQRVINTVTSDNSETLAYAISDSNGSKSKNGKKDRPLCSHCGVIGHVTDKCFKLHGYPPGYKKGKSISTQQSANAVNADDDDTPLNTKQYQQLIAYIQGQMARRSNIGSASTS